MFGLLFSGFRIPGQKSLQLWSGFHPSLVIFFVKGKWGKRTAYTSQHRVLEEVRGAGLRKVTVNEGSKGSKNKSAGKWGEEELDEKKLGGRGSMVGGEKEERRRFSRGNHGRGMFEWLICVLIGWKTLFIGARGLLWPIKKNMTFQIAAGIS